MNKIISEFGNIDVYLFDQILKGRVKPNRKILDAGCGGGRNLFYFLKNGFECYGVDQNELAILKTKELSQNLSPNLPQENFCLESVERMSFTNNSFQFVISNAVLHFAKNESHFEKMLFEMWRVLDFGGILFVRLASDIGIESLVKPLGDKIFLLPDGSTRFLVTQEMLLDCTQKLNATLLDPIKTTNVQNLRCMTTWVLQK
ncbi:MAG: class I SAM-dependent methyltransferase [Calditrichaeota bacterium]|nr:MAG: class I SAM-dependent methyltransferase [Calditrichota bacterium]